MKLASHCEDSDEEIDSVSVVGLNFEKPAIDEFVDCDEHRVRVSSSKTEKRGFGRGQFIREALKRNNPTSSSSFAVARPSFGRGALYANYRN